MTLCLSFLFSFYSSNTAAGQIDFINFLDQSFPLSWWSGRIAETGYEIEICQIALSSIVVRVWCCASRGAGLDETWLRRCCKGCSLCLSTSLELIECLFGVSLWSSSCFAWRLPTLSAHSKLFSPVLLGFSKPWFLSSTHCSQHLSNSFCL